MNVLLIRPLEIVLMFSVLVVLYSAAVVFLVKNKSGILPYIVLILLPIIGPLGIVLGNYLKKE